MERRRKPKKKKLDPYASIRRPTAPPTRRHVPKTKYKRSRSKKELRKEIEEWASN